MDCVKPHQCLPRTGDSCGETDYLLLVFPSAQHSPHQCICCPTQVFTCRASMSNFEDIHARVKGDRSLNDWRYRLESSDIPFHRIDRNSVVFACSRQM